MSLTVILIEWECNVDMLTHIIHFRSCKTSKFEWNWAECCTTERYFRFSSKDLGSYPEMSDSFWVFWHFWIYGEFTTLTDSKVSHRSYHRSFLRSWIMLVNVDSVSPSERQWLKGATRWYTFQKGTYDELPFRKMTTLWIKLIDSIRRMRKLLCIWFLANFLYLAESANAYRTTNRSIRSANRNSRRIDKGI